MKDLTGQTVIISHPSIRGGKGFMTKITTHNQDTDSILIHKATDIDLNPITFRFGGVDLIGYTILLII